MKIKKVLSVILICVLIITASPVTVISYGNESEIAIWDGSVADNFAGGTGTAEDPYQISNGTELSYFASLVNGGEYFYTEYETPEGEYVTEPVYVALTSDINLGGNDFTPIGDPEDYNTASFGGCFDGGGYSITNFYTAGYGLFGKTMGTSDDPESNWGRIKDLTVYGEIECDAPQADVGGIVSRAQGGVIENCSFIGSITVTNATFCYFGGVIGEMENGFVLDCTSRAELSVMGEYRGVGGVIGGAEYNPPLIDGCMNYGDISATANNYIGGISGKGSTVLNSGNRGNITVTEKANEYSSVYASGITAYGSTVINCYNTGDITVNFDMDYGCVAGISQYGEVVNCYSTGTLTAPCTPSVDAKVVTVGGDRTTDSYAPVSDYPMYIYEDEITWEYVSVYSEMAESDMKTEQFVSTLNVWVENNIAYIQSDYDGNVMYSGLYSGWEKCFPTPVFIGVHNVTDGVCTDCESGIDVPDVLKGDVNGDGSITSIDVAVLNTYLLGGSVSIIIEVADLNGDGSVTAVDSSSLAKMLLGSN